MRRTEAFQGARMIKFLDISGRCEAAEFSQVEAADLLGVGERTFRRWRQRFEDAGEAGLLDRRLGRAYKRRNLIERMFCKLKNWRRIATRDDRYAQNYLSGLALAAIMIAWI